MLKLQPNSTIGAVLPSFLTLTFALRVSERFSQAHLLSVCVRGIEGVGLGSYQRPLRCKSQFSESRCRVELSTTSFSQLCRQPSEFFQCLPPSS